MAIGDKGCLSLFGDRPEQHRLFADHLTAEHRVKIHERGRTVDERKLRPERADNHWLDGAVGCSVAASIQGVQFNPSGVSPAPPPVRTKSSREEYEAKRREFEMRRGF